MKPGPKRWLAGWRTLARRLGAAGLAATIVPAGSGDGPPALGIPSLAGPALPTKAEAELIIQRLRGARAEGASPSYVEFQLEELPRRGEARVVPGRLWLGAGDGWAATRIVLGAPGETMRLLIRGGSRPQVWRWTAGSLIRASDLFAPLLPGATITPFDLEMPFLLWPDPRVLSLNHILGRPTYGFIFQAPPDFVAAHPEIWGVRAYLDTRYNAPLKVQLLGPSQRVRNTTSLVSLKKAAGHWIPATLDFRDETTHDKTRFVVTGVAFAPEIAPGLFSPERLGDPEGPAPGIIPVEPAEAADQ